MTRAVFPIALVTRHDSEDQENGRAGWLSRDNLGTPVFHRKLTKTAAGRRTRALQLVVAYASKAARLGRPSACIA